MTERQFEQKYREWKSQSAPELWDRIEQGLEDHQAPGREKERDATAPCKKDEIRKAGNRGVKGRGSEDGNGGRGNGAVGNDTGGNGARRRTVYVGMAAAAAIFLLLMAVPEGKQLWTGENWLRGGAAEGTTGAVISEETVDAAVEEGKEAGGNEVWAEGLAEAGGNEALAEGLAETGGNEAPQEGLAEGLAEAGGNEASAGRLAEASAEGPAAAEWDEAEKPLQVPEGAVTLPADAQYFSEAVLGDTQLLCSGRVEDISLEYDEEGRAVKVAYQLALQGVYYAQNYMDSHSRITVTSPIIAAEGDEVYLLYQLRREGIYLLPLRQREGDWELLYPFAPQIQITENKSYLFHSGYISLVNQETQVVRGSQEGSNDYFYDRMLLREDDNVPAELVSLIQEQAESAQGN